MGRGHDDHRLFVDQRHIGIDAGVGTFARLAGLHAFREKVDRDGIADPDRLAVILARAAPARPITFCRLVL